MDFGPENNTYDKPIYSHPEYIQDTQRQSRSSKMDQESALEHKRRGAARVRQFAKLAEEAGEGSKEGGDAMQLDDEDDAQEARGLPQSDDLPVQSDAVSDAHAVEVQSKKKVDIYGFLRSEEEEEDETSDDSSETSSDSDPDEGTDSDSSERREKEAKQKEVDESSGISDDEPAGAEEDEDGEYDDVDEQEQDDDDDDDDDDESPESED